MPTILRCANHLRYDVPWAWLFCHLNLLELIIWHFCAGAWAYGIFWSTTRIWWWVTDFGNSENPSTRQIRLSDMSDPRKKHKDDDVQQVPWESRHHWWKFQLVEKKHTFSLNFNAGSSNSHGKLPPFLLEVALNGWKKSPPFPRLSA